MKVTKNRYSRVRFLCSNATETCWWPGLCPGSRWGSLQRSHRPPSWIWEGRFTAGKERINV